MPTTPPLCRRSLPSNCGPARPCSGPAPSARPPTPSPPTFFPPSSATSPHTFAAGERLQLTFSLPAPAEIFWDGAYDYSGVSVPAISLVPTATPTATVSPTRTHTPPASATPTATTVPATITVNSVTA